MLQALQPTYSNGVSDLLQNIQKIQSTNNNIAMLEALQGAGSGTIQNSDTGDVLDTLLNPATESDTIDNNDVLNSLLQTPTDSGSSDNSSILQDLGTDTSTASISPEDAVLQALLQTDSNNGDFTNTLQSLQNNVTGDTTQNQSVF
jgi:hypothetical protein